ncbi:MAG TPA: glycosyltransferase family 9 protein [Gemmatimonadaceae bacterium]|nr:glycosyltransferase family 9 protein [Gemmatimonadaceae bacterium]
MSTGKRIERAWKALWMRVLAAIMPAPARGALPEWDARPHRVLYLRYDRIGDMILATGLLRAIARAHPSVALDVLASPANAPILEGSPHVRRVLVFRKKRRSTWPALLRELRAARYDVVIDGMVLTPSLTTLLLMLATGARWRVGIGGRSNDFVYTLPVPPAPADAHMVEQSAVTARPFGIDPARADWRPELFLLDAERERAEETWTHAAGSGARLLVNISSAQARNRWPDERFVEVLRHARRRWPGARVLVIGAPGEAAAVERLARAGGAEPVSGTTLREAVALVAAADVVLTPDTSIAHMAAALGRPSVVMTLERARRFVPYRAPGRVLFAEGDTLQELPLAPVLDALDELLRRADSRCGGSPGIS